MFGASSILLCSAPFWSWWFARPWLDLASAPPDAVPAIELKVFTAEVELSSSPREFRDFHFLVRCDVPDSAKAMRGVVLGVTHAGSGDCDAAGLLRGRREARGSPYADEFRFAPELVLAYRNVSFDGIAFPVLERLCSPAKTIDLLPGTTHFGDFYVPPEHVAPGVVELRAYLVSADDKLIAQSQPLRVRRLQGAPK